MKNLNKILKWNKTIENGVMTQAAFYDEYTFKVTRESSMKGVYNFIFELKITTPYNENYRLLVEGLHWAKDVANLIALGITNV